MQPNIEHVSGQGVTYYGSSNVRNQSRLPPRPIYRPPQRSQAASGPQPGVYQPPQERRLPQQTYFPDTYPPMRRPEPVPVSRSLEIPPQPIYSPTVESTPRPLQTRPLQNQAPAQAPVAPAENFTPMNSEAQSLPETFISKVDELASQLSNLLPNLPGSTPKPASVEEPEVVLQPEAEKELPPLPTKSPSDIEINSQPERVPDLELKPEITPSPSPELILIPEPSIAPTPNQERPTLYPEPLIPVPNPQPVPEPQPIFPDNDFNLLPPAPRPLPTLEPVVLPELVPIIPEPAITSQPESITFQPDYQPLEPPKPVDVYLPPQPMPPPRPNYQPIPDEPVIPSTSRPLIPEPAITSQPESITFQPDYQPLEPPKPVHVYLPPQPMQPPRPNYRPIPDKEVIPSTSRPLSTPVPIELRPNYEPLPPRPIPENRYPSPLPTLILPTPYPNVVPSQPPPQPTAPLPIVIPTSEEPLLEPEIISIMPMYDFECKNGSGYYSIVNECDTYIECQRQGTFKYTCPDGLHFNPQALYPEYPCAYPSEVKCESTATKQIARPTNQCPNRYGFFPILGEDCSKYIMCQEGMATIMNCPFGLVFNEHLSSCDWPENVPQCNSIAFKDFTCPMPPADDPDMLYRFRYGSECGMYVACQRGHPRLLRCDAGLSFDENSQVCIDSDFVPDCRIPIPT